MSNFRVHSNHPYTDIRGIVQTIEEKGNLFAEDSKELHAIHTEIIMSDEVVESIVSAESKGQEQWMSFAQRRKEKFYDAMPRNNILLFSRVSKLPYKLATAKQHINLFSRMYVSCQNGDGDVGNFFHHENHAWPPSLAEDGNMRTSENKSDLLA